MSTNREFSNASVVQLIDATPTPTAMVAPLHRATVTIEPDRIVASDGSLDWSWMAADLVDVVHGMDESWTIFVVPDVAEFGVAVGDGQRDEFRRAVDALFPGRRHAGFTPAALPPPLVEPSLESVAGPSAAATAELPRIVVSEPPPLNAVNRDSEALLLPVPAPSEPVIPWAPPSGPAPTAPAAVSPATSASGGTSPALAGLDAVNISAWFGSHQVLDRVSLSMPAGQVTALIGPSGCGKSTFLRILNRMHEMIPSAQMAGEVLLDGHDVYDPQRKLTAARREIGMVFQKPNPFPAMSIYDNVVASLKLTGTKASQSEKDDLVESCLSKAGLWLEVKDRVRQPGGGLSGGQQQRLCIARALAIKPRVLLMDEPCSALDPTSTRRIEQTITELVSEVTIVIVTHNMQQAARVSNQCAFFLAEHGTPGVIVEHGPTDLMFGSPRDRRTDDYVNGRFG